MTDPAVRVQQLLEEYGTPQACAAELLCDRHPADAVAFTIIETDLTATDLTFGELRERSTRFAAALAGLGVEPGDRVGVLMGKSADLVTVLLGIWRRGAVHVPLFTAFAAPAVAFRLTSSAAKVVVADADQLPKLAPGADLPADPAWRVIVAGTAAGELTVGDLLPRYSADDPRGAAVAVGSDGLLVQLYTSGTTGTPKGVPVPLRALASLQLYQEFGLDVRREDVYWNIADPGWAYGLYYALLTPLVTGMRSLLVHSGFSAPLTWQVLERFGVTNFAAAPTVYRALRADSAAAPTGLTLRRASAAGEPLTPDIPAWSVGTLGLAVRDHYGQTETGMLIANAWQDDVRTETRPGSMGQPLPGFTMAILAEDADRVLGPKEQGRVVVDTLRSPGMWFAGYVDAPEKTASRYAGDGRWYLTGDAGMVDEDGHFYFSARDDDVIIMAGYRIGPFDVESVLVMHDSVIEAAVVGMPDELRGEVIEAFVVLREGAEPGPALETELRQLVKTKFAAHAYPRTVHFVDSLPKTPSGKVQRFLLRQR
ncbi:AMP-binding protein [Nocardia goodfellowii]|uniref:Acetyl-CoA synthetase n=1 Tax=Nocardia goodfellowii TaxID=882446 RepID=A0ABS4QRD3_9NOCA|nr:AMP-binding protein [Nocardia goodfellowii]MBP2194239.1 acetyl-CoA synthetase [Nocardia goodfellowii]